MVKKEKHQNKTVFVCSICGFGYSDEKTATECENYCKKFNSCSIDITKKAIYKPK